MRGRSRPRGKRPAAAGPAGDRRNPTRQPAVAKRRGVWKQRYAEINEWERYLAGNGFRIVKLFLNLSREEQRRRLLRRLDLPDHRWQFSPADVTERGFWDEYQKAYSEVLSHPSTEWAPWYVIPADWKWFARIAAASVLVSTLMEIEPRSPVIDGAQEDALLEIKQRLEAEAPDGAAPDPYEAELRGAS